MTEIGVRTLSKGVIRSLIEYIDYLGHGGGGGTALVLHNCGAGSFQFGSFQAKCVRCLSNFVATRMMSHNVVEDNINEFCQCEIKTTVTNKDRFNFKKIN